MASFSSRKTSLKAMWVTVLLVVTTAALIATPPTAEAMISCNSVLTTLSPCLNFVLFGGDTPSTECCYGVKSVYNAATTKEDRQAVCSCLKSVANSATPSMIKNAAEIPGKCGVSLPYVISPSTDCSKVSQMMLMELERRFSFNEHNCLEKICPYANLPYD